MTEKSLIEDTNGVPQTTNVGWKQHEREVQRLLQLESTPPRPEVRQSPVTEPTDSALVSAVQARFRYFA